MVQQNCPRCGSDNVEIKMYKENAGSQTITRTKSKYKEKGHGCLWWLLIGWWWWAVDLFLWIFLFIPRLIIQLFKKKKYVGHETSVSTTRNSVHYRSMCLCKSCGYNWDAASVAPVARKMPSANSTPQVKAEPVYNALPSVNAKQIVSLLNDSDCSLALVSALGSKNEFTVEDIQALSNYDYDRANNVAQLLSSGGFTLPALVNGQNGYTWSSLAKM